MLRRKERTITMERLAWICTAVFFFLAGAALALTGAKTLTMALILALCVPALYAVSGLRAMSALGKADARRRSALSHAIDGFLLSSPPSEETIPGALRILCGQLRWRYGEFWSPDPHSDLLHCESAWHDGSPETAEFESISRKMTMGPGIGLPGRAWQNRAPSWIPDVTRDANFPRAAYAARAGLHGAFAFPILLEGRFLGVFAFFSPRIEKPDERLLSSCGDISARIGGHLQRKRMEEALHRSESRYGMIVREALEGIWVLDDKGVTAYANPALARALGYGDQEMSGRHFLDFVCEEERAAAIDGFERRKRGIAEKFERRYRRKDGTEVLMMVSSNPVMSSAGRMASAVVFAFDITEAKRREKLIADQQMKMIVVSRLSALGEMAGGIAHEINTPLGIICMKTAQLRHQLQGERLDRPKALETLDGIESTTFRISRIIKGLRSFARDGSSEKRQLSSLRAIVGDTVAFCAERFRSHGVRFTASEIPESLLLECGATQISQVILNLLNNAYDAVLPLEDRWIRLDVEDAGARVMIAVSDSGPGIGPAIHDKIMQPFFTTKDIDKGTGLGLSISKGIVESHFGKLYLDTAAKNTRFVIELPKRQPGAQKAA